MNNFFILVCLVMCNVLFAQTFSDNFADGNFTNNPTWTGDIGNFDILNGELHLADSIANESVLLTAVAQQENQPTTWAFDFRMEFAPSSSNRARVYLQSNSTDLAENLQGYFIMLGESGSEDAIKLYKQSGSTNTLLIEGTAGDIADNPSASVRVTRSAVGEWELSYDLDGSGFNSYGTATDTDFLSGSYMGVWCDYIASRADLFYFDNFLIDPIYIDTENPTLESTVVISSNQIVLTFSEPLDVAASNTSNFTIDGNTIATTTVSEDNTAITVTFENDFIEETTQTINFTVFDISGNELSNSATFTYITVNTFDILITEIMADPSPTVSLPDLEYVELYNRSDNSINLKDWQFLDASTTQITLPSYELGAGEYVLLCKESFAFDALGTNYIPVSLQSLTNGGELLQLIDNQENTIATVDFSVQWHASNKNDGGWSLEMINTNNPCGGAENWASSNDSRGGSPAEKNSVFDNSNNDTQAPNLVRVGYINEATIQAYFDEPLDISKITATNFNIDNGIGEPLIATAITPNNNSVVLSLDNLISENTIYTLTVSNICDCVGNVVDLDNFSLFAMPVMPDSSDVILNELLFNQATGSVDYVELYNKSDKVLDLKNYRFTRDGYETVDNETIFEDNPLEVKVTESSYLFFPEQYLVLTTSELLVKQQYFTENENAFLEVDGFPTLDASQDAIWVKDSLGNILDQVLYSDDWHYALIDNDKGVSLERIDFDVPAQSVSSWHSASANVGYGTPGYLNSQFFQLPELTDSFSISPEVFSPDGDAYNDFTVLEYAMNQEGFTMNVHIFDDRGREVRHLVQNELLGRSGTYKWDGTNDNGEKANIGIYVFFIEIFDLTGKVERFKQTCTLAGQLE